MKTNKLIIFAIALLLMTMAAGIALANGGDIDIDIDIKPGSEPNSINLKSNGVISVAILTTDDFDASTVDPTTVIFASASPLRWTIEDVDGDGDQDLVLKFKVKETGIALGEADTTLTGETYDGIPIEGTDSIRIVPTD
ncbi:hypothetical protein RE476_03350 [Methanolobus mangrovi]|uniref:VCBS repeat-containing protein n=1 Tax=Methanolobus mangrovi TaxID=3072977 RepID=A0AA51UGP0_9EURY|nr:hypothetical protein [Methanolobus mangrovi]WMW22873.1 hypothetical protein RE476_03350 [Methanolobus mangrovi]